MRSRAYYRRERTDLVLCALVLVLTVLFVATSAMALTAPNLGASTGYYIIAVFSAISAFLILCEAISS